MAQRLTMNHGFYSDAYIREVLQDTYRIALIGASNKADRASYSVMAYMLSRGYCVIPVNPRLAGQSILGKIVVARLEDIDGQIHMVDIFRNSDSWAGYR